MRLSSVIIFSFVGDRILHSAPFFLPLNLSFNTSDSDGVVNNSSGTCVTLRREGEIQTPNRDCMLYKEAVQVMFKDGKPRTMEWHNQEYVFVISYEVKEDRGRGWVLANAVDFDRSPAR